MSRTNSVSTSFTILLVILAGVLVLQPFLRIESVSDYWLRFVSLLVMLSVMSQITPRRGVWVLSALAAGIHIGLATLRFWIPGYSLITAEHASAIVFMFLVAGSITLNVWREREVTPDTIVGGIAVYVIVAAAFSGIFQLMEFVQPGSFIVTTDAPGLWGEWEPSPGRFPRLLFFSFVTITTLGYGDIVPASGPAAGLVTVEAVLGPLYLTILIARLVGLHIAGVQRRRDEPGAGESPRPG